MIWKKLKDFFVPHKGNGYAPNSLEKTAIVGILFLVILSFTATNLLSLLWNQSSHLVGSVLPAIIVDLTNKERGTESLKILARSPLLDRAAQLKAEDMATHEYFAHYSPDGISPWHWFQEVSYTYVNAGENLAIYFSDSNDVVDAWMQSPAHRANIMDGKYTEIGVGTAEGTYKGVKTVYVVQLFGTPGKVNVSNGKTIAHSQVKTKTTNATTHQNTRVLSESVTVPEHTPASTTAPVVSPSVPVLDTQEDGYALYSDLIATTTSDTVAIVVPTPATAGTSAPFFLGFATAPHRLLEFTYFCIGLFVLFALILSVFIEIRHQQPLQVVYSIGLLTLMFGLFYIHSHISTGAFIL